MGCPPLPPLIRWRAGNIGETNPEPYRVQGLQEILVSGLINTDDYTDFRKITPIRDLVYPCNRIFFNLCYHYMRAKRTIIFNGVLKNDKNFSYSRSKS